MGQGGEGGQLFHSWGWSDTSLEEAKQHGDERARQVAKNFAMSGRLERRHYYGDRPFREEILEKITDGDGKLAAVVTRNSYGCEVLNTARVMFVDVDLEEEGEASAGWWSRLLGRRGAPPKNPEVFIERARQWAERNAGWCWRVYRTRAGLRFMATHAFFNPQEASKSGVFEALNADPLYRRLCENQKCFRARLTPKPWRCGVNTLTVSWPWADQNCEKRFRKWQREYEREAAEYSTCALVTTLGTGQTQSEISSLVKLHDERTRVGSSLPLA